MEPIETRFEYSGNLLMDLYFFMNTPQYVLFGNRFNHWLDIGYGERFENERYAFRFGICIQIRTTEELHFTLNPRAHASHSLLRRQYREVLRFAFSEMIMSRSYHAVPSTWTQDPRWYWKRNFGWLWSWRIFIDIVRKAGLKGNDEVIRDHIHQGIMHDINLVDEQITEDPYAMAMVVFGCRSIFRLKRPALKISVRPKWFPPYPQLDSYLRREFKLTRSVFLHPLV